MIDTREELVLALREAAEIEHGLMIQYLFPALTMKKHLSEGLTGPQQRLAREWEGVILRVAVEEMGHLATVSNLLAAVGAGPHLSRPNFPQQVGYYPFAFDLVPFSDEALYRMLVFELPQGHVLPDPPARPQEASAFDAVAPDELEYTFVGELYEQIRQGFASLDERTLFIGPPEAQIDDDWSVELDVRRVVDRAGAFAAIDDIVRDGEGTPADRRGSHYARFLDVRKEYADAGHFAAARDVVPNPQTRDLRGAGPGTVLTHPDALRTAELFNAVYEVVLLLLAEFFALGGGTRAKQAVRSAAARLMSTGIRPIAEVLTEMPAGDPADPRRAGPPFELYSDVALSPFPAARWTFVLERLAAIVAEAVELGDRTPRLSAVGETIGFVRRSLVEVAP